MERRDFIQKTAATGAFVVASGAALGMEAKEQKVMKEKHPNLVLIDRFFQAYASNSLQEMNEIISADIKWHIPGKHPLSGTKNGINEVLEFFKKLNKASFKAEPIVLGVNDNFVIDCHRNWSNLENEENLDAMSCLLWKIEGNKIVEVYNFPQDQHLVDFFFSKVF